MPTEQIKKTMEHPMIAALAMITVVVTGFTAVGTATGWYDEAHTTKAELKIVQDQVTALSIKASCETLAIRIALAEQAIWQAEQTQSDGQRLVEKRRELGNLLSKYNALKCSSVLA